MPAAAVAGDSQDRIYCFNRDPDHPIVIFDREGNYLSSWGAGLITFAHANCYCHADTHRSFSGSCRDDASDIHWRDRTTLRNGKPVGRLTPTG